MNQRRAGHHHHVPPDTKQEWSKDGEARLFRAREMLQPLAAELTPPTTLSCNVFQMSGEKNIC